MSLLEIGVTGLRAHQQALITTGHNITNASVEGYSRQEVVFGTNVPRFEESHYVGTGVSVTDVQRITDEFLTRQIHSSTSLTSSFETLQNGLGEIDRLLSDSNTGLNGAMGQFFSSIQAVSDSPSSIPLRQQVLSEAESLLERFQSIDAQLDRIQDNVDSVIEAEVQAVSLLAQSIADLNEAIVSGSASGATPNDLLDERDEILRQLASKVSFTTSVTAGNQVNVFVAGSETLVLGTESNELVTVGDRGSPEGFDVAVRSNGQVRVITDKLAAGTIGGALTLRNQGIDVTTNQLGLVQQQMMQATNSLHTQGVDLDGNLGALFFSDINNLGSQLARVFASRESTTIVNGVESSVRVEIKDIAQLDADSYKLQVGPQGSGTAYTITNSSGTVVQHGGLAQFFPQTIELDAFDIHIDAADFSSSQSFIINPSRIDVGRARVELTDPAQLALALNITTSEAQFNTGAGLVSQAQSSAQQDSIQLQAIADQRRALNPPLGIRFTSTTTYDVLDLSDPTSPQQLNPPLKNLSYLPNRENTVLGYGLATALMSSTASFSDTVSVGAAGTVNNANPGETISVQVIDFETGSVSSRVISVGALESAGSAAARLNDVEGIQAFASTELSLTLNDSGSGAPLEIDLNGVALFPTGLAGLSSPITADYMASRINEVFSGGDLIASSDGTNVTIRSLSGEDIQLENVGADAADTFTVHSVNGNTLASAATVTRTNEAVVAGELSLLLDDGVSVSSTGGFFANSTEETPAVYLGYDVNISGVPNVGDEFYINTGSSGPADNRNALALSQIQGDDVFDTGVSILQRYTSLVGEIGNKAAAAEIDAEAAQSILNQQLDIRGSISGVNLDEEAANLLRYEQVYNASAQIISVARQLFDSLLSAFR